MIIENMIRHHGDIHGDIVRKTSDLVLQSHPGIILTRKYTLPFFVLKNNLCYMDIQKKKPILAICHGSKIASIAPMLNFTGRKYVGHFSLLNLDRNKMNDLLFIINEMIIFDLNQ